MAKKHRPAKTQPKSTSTPAPRPVNLNQPLYNRLAIIALFGLPLVFFGKFLFGAVMMFGTDFIGAGGYAARQFMAEYIRKHLTVAFWQPHILSGQPTVAAFFGDLFYPTLLLRLFLPVHIVWAWTFYLHTVLAGLGTYLFLKELKLDTPAAFLGGVAYMFSGSLLTLAYAGHDGRLIGSALMPLALFFLTRGVNRWQLRRQVPQATPLIWFLLTGLVLALQLLSGHIQKVYYTGLILVAYFLFLFIRIIRQEKNRTAALPLLVYFVIGVILAGALAAIQYLPIYSNLPYGARGADRGYEFATSWSMPIAEIFDLLTPNFSGGLWNYWSKNPFKLHSEYLGILPLFFALIALVRGRKKPEVKFFFFAFLVTVLLAWGGNTPLYRIPYYLLPGLSKFRGPGMIFFLATFTIAVLAGYGVDHLLKESATTNPTKRLRFLIYALGALLALLIFALIGRDALAGILNPGPRLNQFLNNYPALITGLVFATFLWLLGYLLTTTLLRRRLPPLPFVIITAVIMTSDIGINLKLWHESRGYIRSMPRPTEYFAPDEVVRFLKPDTTIYRVLPLHYERSDEGELWLHNIHSTGGQIPNPLQTYQEFIGAEGTVLFQANNLLNPNFMNLLNIKYIITYNLPDDISPYDAQTRQLITQLRTFFNQPQFSRVFTGSRYSIYENKDYLPRAFIVPDYEVVNNKEEVFSRLLRPDFNPAQTALLYKNPGLPPADTATFRAAARITTYDANQITINASLNVPGILILSENYHPDWQVQVDGNPATLLQAFHTLRAVALPPGNHQVKFFYRSESFNTGMLISILATLILAGTGLFAGLRQRRKRNSPPPGNDASSG